MLNFKIQKTEKTDYIKLESADENDTQENDRKLKEEGKIITQMAGKQKKKRKGKRRQR